MSSANYLVRRAVVDDLPALEPLWQSMNFSPEELEKRLTDFQVAVDGQEKVLGAVAFEVVGNQGRIHHEAFSDFGVADAVRLLFWEKLQMLAQNNLVFRVWTQETAPFWKQAGLQPPGKDELQKLPAKWTAAGGWLTLQLKEEAAIQALTGTGEIEMLMQMERERTRHTLKRAKLLKTVATVLAIIFAVFVGAMILYAFKHDPNLMERLQR